MDFKIYREIKKRLCETNSFKLLVEFQHDNKNLELRRMLLHLVDEGHIKKIGHSSLQYGLFFSNEYNQIVLGMIRNISTDMIQLVHYVVISDKTDSDLRVKKCDGCILNERDNNKSKNCWVSLFRNNTFSINITSRNILMKRMVNGLLRVCNL
jgi:hypothetical protein